MKNYVPVLLSAVLLLSIFSGYVSKKPAEPLAEPELIAEEEPNKIPTSKKLAFSDSVITLDGEPVTTDSSKPVFLSHDIVFFEDKTEYGSGSAYGEGGKKDRYTAEEADENIVINIATAGSYELSGTLSYGQILVDLGNGAKSDPTAVVYLILGDTDITCTAAPAIVFKNVYECCPNSNKETATSEIDTSNAGANLIVAAKSKNTVKGSRAAKTYEDYGEEKILCRQDSAVYSYMSMNIDGTESGVLNIVSDNEGLDTERHLTINGGNINIHAEADGIKTNKGGVSVITVNGGNLHITAGLGTEGNGIDSDGRLVINGGTVIASANSASSAGLIGDTASIINGGTVVALGSATDWKDGGSAQVVMNLQFAEYRNPGDAIVVKNGNNTVFAYDPSEDEILGKDMRKFSGALISSPDFSVGNTYSIYAGGVLSGNRQHGIFSTVTAYSSGKIQSYTVSDGLAYSQSNGESPTENSGKEQIDSYFDFFDRYLNPRDNSNEFSGRKSGSFGGWRIWDWLFGSDDNADDGGYGSYVQDLNPEFESSTEFKIEDTVNSFSGVKDD